MKVLCICEKGNSRSVTLAYLLKKEFGYDALAMGMNTAGLNTKRMLYEWADRIIVVDKRFANKIPADYRTKMKVWDVGPDRFFIPPNQELLDLYQHYLDAKN